MRSHRLFAYSLAHLLVDAACASTIMNTPEIAAVFLLYNTFAFSTQCFVGLLMDSYKPGKFLTPISCILVALCCFLPIPPLVRATCIGLGNSIFHVAAGREVLLGAAGKAAPLGMFVAPGALGVFFGKTAPQWNVSIGVVLLAYAVALFMECRRDNKETQPFKKECRRLLAIIPVVLLLLAVGTRAIGGALASHPGQSTFYSVFAVLLVFLGKSVGGFVNDRFGSKLTACISLPLAVVFLLLGNSLTVCLGQFLLNISMPITLYLLYRCMPDSPGFAFGLAAAALWPGTLIGQFLSTRGEIHTMIIILCFSVSLYAVIYSERSFSNEKKN